MAHKSLVKKITNWSTTLIFCAFLIALAANYWHALSKSNAAQKKQLARQTALLSQSLESPLWSLDDNAIKLIGDAFMAGADAVSLIIYAQQSETAIYHEEKETSATVLYSQKDISHKNQVIGHVKIGLSGASYATELSRLLMYSMTLALLIILPLTFVMKILFREHLAKPLEILGAWTDRVASGDFSGPPPSIELEELSTLADRFTNMSEKIQNRELSLLASERKFRGLFENTEVSIWNEDVSEVIAALEKLRQNGVKDLRQYLQDNLQTAWGLAAKVKVNQVNDATLKLFGATSHHEMLTQIDKTFGPDSIEIFIDELCAIWNQQKTFRAETSYRTLDGKNISAIISFHIPETPEGFQSLPISVFDITDLKQAEEELSRYRDQLELLVEDKTQKLKAAQAELLQRERLATLGELTATVSHELRNPLGTIQTALFSIGNSLNSKDPFRANRSLELAERSINRCVKIIEELNSYTRVKGLQLTVASLDEWLRGVLDDQVIPVEIQCELLLSCGTLVMFDQDKLRQVVINLVTNAVHALQDSDASSKHLQIATSSLSNEYQIQVRDNGIGMSNETMQKMFEPLFSTKGFGVGLGMVIVKNIVEQHRGRITVESEPGEGTVVTVCLPIDLTEH